MGGGFVNRSHCDQKNKQLGGGGGGGGSSEVTMLHIIWYMVAEVSLPSFKQPRWLLYYIIMLTW